MMYKNYPPTAVHPLTIRPEPDARHVPRPGACYAVLHGKADFKTCTARTPEPQTDSNSFLFIHHAAPAMLATPIAMRTMRAVAALPSSQKAPPGTHPAKAVWTQ